jgi:cardiolipin synthase
VSTAWLSSLGHLPGWFLLALHVSLQFFFAGRALLRPHREPASRLAWVVVIVVAPIVGMLAYVLFGETNIGSRRIARFKQAMARLPSYADIGRHEGEAEAGTAPRFQALFRVGRSISGFPEVGGNRGRLLVDSDDVIDHIVADIDAAREHVHVCFYIWLSDTNGLKVVDALKRAAERGVTCRAMADDLGSRAMVRSDYWKEMDKAGVRLAVLLPIGFPLSRPLKGRIDMRNHRKIVVIDNRVTYCGSNNCADAAFAIKPRFAPWVDAMIRFEGPIVLQNQHVFATDWMAHTNEDLSGLFAEPVEVAEEGFPAQVIATGATVRYSAMPEIFESLMYTARDELVVTTPYYVPDEPIQAARCASARRGVDTTIVFPAKNDSWIVAAASHSYYEELLDAGVTIYEYVGGLLHTKSLTIDGQATLIGSANIDRRSFELNFENNILFVDKTLTAAVRARQATYIAASSRIELADVAAWSRRRRLWNNAVAMLGPVL